MSKLLNPNFSGFNAGPGGVSETTGPIWFAKRLGRAIGVLLFASIGIVLAAGTASADTAVPVPSVTVKVLDGPTGLPVLVDVDQSTGRTTVYPCADRSCESYQTIQLDLGLPPTFVAGWTPYIDPDGHIAVALAYGGGVPGERTRLVVCTQVLCADRNVTIAELPRLDQPVMTSAGEFRGIEYRDGTEYLLRCDDRACSTYQLTPMQLPVGGSFRIDDEYARVELDVGTATLQIVRCVNACTETAISTVELPADSINSSGPGSLQFDPVRQAGDGPAFLVVKHRDIEVQTLVTCADAACTNPQITRLETPVRNNREFLLNDLGHLVYLDAYQLPNGQPATEVVTCGDVACSTTSSSKPVYVTRSLSISPEGWPRHVAGRWLLTCDARNCGSAELPPLLIANCQGPQGIADLAVDGSLEGWSLRSGESESTTLAGLTYVRGVVRMGGRGGADGNGVAGVIAVRSGVEEVSAALNYACTGPATHDASSTCQAERGRIDVRVASEVVPRSFSVSIGDLAPRVLTVDAGVPVNEARGPSGGYPDHGSVITSTSGQRNGPVPVTIVDTATGQVVFDKTLAIDCEPAVLETAEVTVVSSCLAGRGRIDVNIANPTDASQDYRVELEEDRVGAEGFELVRTRRVDGRDWWRLPVTGRLDGAYSVTVHRGDERAASTRTTVSCAPGAERVDEPEVQVVNACRNGLGYILFLLSNDTAATRSWVIEFTGVPNRSTSAAPYGQTVRAVTGRPPGTYTATIGEFTFDIAVDCGAVGGVR